MPQNLEWYAKPAGLYFANQSAQSPSFNLPSQRQGENQISRPARGSMLDKARRGPPPGNFAERRRIEGDKFGKNKANLEARNRQTEAEEEEEDRMWEEEETRILAEEKLNQFVEEKILEAERWYLSQRKEEKQKAELREDLTLRKQEAMHNEIAGLLRQLILSNGQVPQVPRYDPNLFENDNDDESEIALTETTVEAELEDESGQDE